MEVHLSHLKMMFARISNGPDRRSTLLPAVATDPQQKMWRE